MIVQGGGQFQQPYAGSEIGTLDDARRQLERTKRGPADGYSPGLQIRDDPEDLTVTIDKDDVYFESHETGVHGITPREKQCRTGGRHRVAQPAEQALAEA